MKSIEERLADSNPVTGEYIPANYDEMLARVVRHARPVDSMWRAFRLRMAGSVAAASALTVLGVSALNGAGSSLPVLGFSASPSHAPTASALKGSTGIIGGVMIPLMRNYTFTGAEQFSNTTGSAPVYVLGAPHDLAATLNDVAAVLGVTLGSVVDPSNSTTYYGVSGTGYSGSISSYGGPAYWNLSQTPSGASAASGSVGSTGSATSTPAGASGPSGPSGATGATGVTGPTGATGATGPVAATGSLADRARAFVGALGDYSVGSATQSVAGGVTTITVPLLIGGYLSDLSDSFNFNSDGSLQSASGAAFTLSRGPTYPMISESAGVGQITAQQNLFRRFVDYGVVTPTSPNLGAPQVSSPPAGTTVPSAVSGSSGPNGVTGVTGVTAPTTSTVTGPTGPSGSTPTSIVSGATGPTGPSGSVAPPPTVVNLVGVTTGYSSYEMAGNVWMELPVYHYTGVVVTGGYHVSFDVVALPSQYLDFAPIMLPLGAR